MAGTLTTLPPRKKPGGDKRAPRAGLDGKELALLLLPPPPRRRSQDWGAGGRNLGHVHLQERKKRG